MSRRRVQAVGITASPGLFLSATGGTGIGFVVEKKAGFAG